jgi:hypothetical protein
MITEHGLLPCIEATAAPTSLKAATRSQSAKDALLLRNGDVGGRLEQGGYTGRLVP